jgi:hypothetical protein
MITTTPELTMAELERETVELLPARELMCGNSCCRPCCDPCITVRCCVEVCCVRVDVAASV